MTRVFSNPYFLAKVRGVNLFKLYARIYPRDRNGSPRRAQNCFEDVLFMQK